MAENGDHQNALLRQLPPREFQRLAASLKRVTLSFKEIVYEQDHTVKYAYFPTSGVVSLVTLLDDGGEIIETGTVGREGMVGIPAFLGIKRAPGRAICQIPGSADRLPVNVLSEHINGNGTLGPLLMRYTNALMAMLAQTAACNRAHSLEERMCRWLLMTRDRVDSDEFPLTQEFLGQMLGVRRPSVSLAGATLQRGGLIRYSRGRITVLDRAALEAASCECYRFLRKQFEAALQS